MPRRKLVREPFPESNAASNPVDRPKPAPVARVAAAELRRYIHHPLELTWGVGCQQNLQTTRASLIQVTDKYILLKVGLGRGMVDPLIIPLSFLIRFSEVFDG